MVTRSLKLSDADRARLRRLIEEGEIRSSAELVLIVADACGGYGLFALLWPALAALLAGGVLALTMPQLGAARLFLAEATVFVVLVAILQWPPALLRLVPQQVRRAHAQQIAEHQFALRVHGRTPKRTGVLLLVALAERQVFVLPDDGISAVIEPSSWSSIVDRLVAALRAGPATEAIAAALAEIMQLLERHFPPVAGSGDALPEIIELPASSRVDIANG